MLFRSAAVINALAIGGEVAVVGLGRSGRAAALLLRRDGATVYASDGGTGALVERTAAELRALGVDARTGGHDLDRIARASVVVASPGVPPDAAPLACAVARGVPIVSEVEVALGHLAAARVIAVTGTNGKTTVTALVDHLLRALGRDSVAAGNIGLALAEVALREPPPAWVALEVSSFQLHDTPSLSPAVGILTNLAPDHLDRYPALEDYYADKMRLFSNATDASVWSPTPTIPRSSAGRRACGGSASGSRCATTAPTPSFRVPATSSSTRPRSCRAPACRCSATTTSPTRSPPCSR